MEQKGQVQSDLGKLISYSARLKEIMFLKEIRLSLRHKGHFKGYIQLCSVSWGKGTKELEGLFQIAQI